MRVGVLLNFNAAWLGAHYSPFYRRWCVNLVPFVTVWYCLKGGTAPQRAAPKE